MSIEKGTQGGVVVAGDPTELEGIFFLIIQSFAQKFGVFVTADYFLIDLIDQIEIVAVNMQFFAFE